MLNDALKATADRRSRRISRNAARVGDAVTVGSIRIHVEPAAAPSPVVPSISRLSSQHAKALGLTQGSRPC